MASSLVKVHRFEVDIIAPLSNVKEFIEDSGLDISINDADTRCPYAIVKDTDSFDPIHMGGEILNEEDESKAEVHFTKIIAASDDVYDSSGGDEFVKDLMTFAKKHKGYFRLEMTSKDGRGERFSFLVEKGKEKKLVAAFVEQKIGNDKLSSSSSEETKSRDFLKELGENLACTPEKIEEKVHNIESRLHEALSALDSLGWRYQILKREKENLKRKNKKKKRIRNSSNLSHGGKQTTSKKVRKRTCSPLGI